MAFPLNAENCTDNSYILSKLTLLPEFTIIANLSNNKTYGGMQSTFSTEFGCSYGFPCRIHLYLPLVSSASEEPSDPFMFLR